MSAITSPMPNGGESLEELANMVAILSKQVQYLMAGNLSTKNIREVGGWLADPQRFVSIDGDVGMSTEDTGGDDVRYFAGNTDMNIAPWRVTKGGKMHSTGGTIESAAGYPKVVFDPTGNLLGVYLDGNNFLELVPSDPGTGAPSFRWVAGGSDAAFQYVDADQLEIQVIARELNLTTQIQGNINLNPAVGYNVSLPSLFSTLFANTGLTLQDAFDSKANTFSGASGTVYVASSPGGSPTTAINFSNGVRTS